jgi:eukaryotic-like serine/threonine-protein kinase
MSASGTEVLFAGRYRLDGRIAAGGMGEVWRGADTVLRRPVAIKVMRAGFAEQADTRARFRAEAQHAAALSHPGIAQVYDYGEGGHGQPPFLVMELVDGPPLTELLARGPLAPALVLDIVAQTADGLDAAHAAGLVHRDIKPGNLLIGRGGILKITDFGIAHATGAAPLTRTGMLMGTPAYMAPERVAGLPATAASDLYALGIVAYECLAGKLPFTGTPLEVALAHQNRDLPALPDDIPWEVAELVADLTERDPDARPASAAEVAVRARQLRDLLARSVTTAADPWPAQAEARQQPSRTMTDMSTAALHGAAGAPVTRQEPRQARHPILLAVAVIALVVVGLGGWLVYANRPSANRQRPPAATQKTTPVTVGLVRVGGAALVGDPVREVAQRLHQLGLGVSLNWVLAPFQTPGTVLRVTPSGYARPGSTVVLTVTYRHQHGHGNGNGGNGNDG